MSVLIKGMEMPKTCGKCQIKNAIECNRWKLVRSVVLDRHKDCPLVTVQPHGRLIDGDVAEAITVNFDEAKGDFWDGILYAADWISKQPTIVPAEEVET